MKKENKTLVIALGIGGAVVALVAVCVVCVGAVFLFGRLAASPKPPHGGVFLRENGTFIDLEEGTAQTSNRRPVVVLWVPNVDLSYLTLSGPDGSVAYSLTPLDEEMYELQPRNPLSPGQYTLTAGHPLLSPSQIPRWHFDIVP